MKNIIDKFYKKVKENGDWVYNKKLNKVFQIPHNPDNNFIENVDIRDCEKIVGTTDESLNTIEQIPFNFIKLFTIEYNKGNHIKEIEWKINGFQ